MDYNFLAIRFTTIATVPHWYCHVATVIRGTYRLVLLLWVEGALGRFINHSCEPNCETQKWMVRDNELAIGLFTTKDIPANTELTFDYNFERYGDKVAAGLCALLEHASADELIAVYTACDASTACCCKTAAVLWLQHFGCLLACKRRVHVVFCCQLSL